MPKVRDGVGSEEVAEHRNGLTVPAMISIVIPTLNEARSLPETLSHTLRAARGDDIELIVSDCGSRDGTQEFVRDQRLQLVCGGMCRAGALNAGAGMARGDVLLFLHADSLLPEGFTNRIRHALTSAKVIGGAFEFDFSGRPHADKWIEHCLRSVVMCNRIRYRWTHNFYGDQCIFVRRHIFQRVGGFPRVRLMEDIGFCQRIKRFGRMAILQPPVRTSPRRFVDRGVLRQFIEDLTLLGFASLGIQAERRWHEYNAWNERAAAALVSPSQSSMSAVCLHPLGRDKLPRRSVGARDRVDAGGRT